MALVARAALDDHRLLMMFEQFNGTLHETDAASAYPRAAGAKKRKTSHSLVLFIGADCQPQLNECDTLSRSGMRCLWLPGIEQALVAARSARFDAVVIDAATLDTQFTTALPRLREGVGCPVIMLAERGDEVDEIIALELGADAFLFRPVAPRRLRAHVLALLRWCGQARHAAPAVNAEPPNEAPPARRGAPWELDRVGNRLLGASGSVPLTEVQCAFLQCLQEARGRVVPRARLAAAMPNGHTVHARSVDVYIHRLRKRLLDAGVHGLDIQSMRGRGYALNPPA
jgi:DNA-binding response OmpR family regulator